MEIYVPLLYRFFEYSHNSPRELWRESKVPITVLTQHGGTVRDGILVFASSVKFTSFLLSYLHYSYLHYSFPLHHLHLHPFTGSTLSPPPLPSDRQQIISSLVPQPRRVPCPPNNYLSRISSQSSSYFPSYQKDDFLPTYLPSLSFVKFGNGETISKNIVLQLFQGLLISPTISSRIDPIPSLDPYFPSNPCSLPPTKTQKPHSKINPPLTSLPP
jgi:hypothetical protein